MMLTTKQKIHLGIAEMLAGVRQEDDERSANGQAMVDIALDSIPAPAIDPDLLWELNRTGTDMLDCIDPDDFLDSQIMRKYLSARGKFQTVLARVREGRNEI